MRAADKGTQAGDPAPASEQAPLAERRWEEEVLRLAADGALTPELRGAFFAVLDYLAGIARELGGRG